MPIVQAKCTNCGANLQVDNSKEAAICPYCDSAYIVEKAINNYQITNHIQANVVNIYGGQEDFEIVAGKLVKYHGSSPDVVLPENISVLGKGSLLDCTYLERIVIPKSLKAIEHLSLPLLPKKEITICVDSLEHWCAIDAPHELVATCSLNLSINGSIIRNLQIPRTVLYIPKYAFANFRSIESVQFHPNCIAISDGAFAKCENLTDVRFSQSLKTIGHSAFSSCTRLQHVTLPDSITSIGSGCFASCKSLTNVSLSYNLSSIPSFAFAGCDALKQINIPSKVQSIEHDAFLNCKVLSEVNIPNKVITIGTQAFLNTPYGEKKKGCYIATAVYSSYDCPQVWTLRRFRDDTLASTWYGRLFIQIYYAISPTLVRWFGHTNWFKDFWKVRLDKMVNNLQENGVESTPYQDKVW